MGFEGLHLCPKFQPCRSNLVQGTMSLNPFSRCYIVKWPDFWPKNKYTSIVKLINSEADHKMYMQVRTTFPFMACQETHLSWLHKLPGGLWLAMTSWMMLFTLLLCGKNLCCSQEWAIHQINRTWDWPQMYWLKKKNTRWIDWFILFTLAPNKYF